MDRKVVEIHAPTAEVRHENRHNAIKSQIVDAQRSVPNLSLPQNGLPNRTPWISGADFSILQNRPTAIAIRLNVCRGRHAGNSSLGSPMAPIRWYISTRWDTAFPVGQNFLLC